MILAAGLAAARALLLVAASAVHARACDDPPPRRLGRLGPATTLSGDAALRLRGNAVDRAQARSGDRRAEVWQRAVVGADLRHGAHLRLRAELGRGLAMGTPEPVPANLHNAGAVQQLFVEVRARLGAFDGGAIVGRQEFADGPRQLLSVGDGANLHRTWNGLRLFAAVERLRFGAFALRATALDSGWFDDDVRDGERLHGLHMGFEIVPAVGGTAVHVDPFWFHSELPGTRWGHDAGLDERDTVGARLHGSVGAIAFDSTVAHQSGAFAGRGVDAFGAFVAASVALSDGGWRPRLTVHLDVGSGGGAGGDGSVRGFHPLRASSACLGEGAFLSASNLLLVAPGVAATPAPDLRLAIEYGFARRLTDDDAAYAGRLRPYAGTEAVAGHETGQLLRVSAAWELAGGVSLTAGIDHLVAGPVLERAGFGSATFGYASVRVRF